MADLLPTAESIAREAGALLRDFYHRGVRTEYKGDVDLVTEADRASEALIGTRLRAAFPEHGIYGEEGTREGLDGEFRWYVDPLDGTTNFAHGFPAFLRRPRLRAATSRPRRQRRRPDDHWRHLRSAARRDVLRGARRRRHAQRRAHPRPPASTRSTSRSSPPAFPATSVTRAPTSTSTRSSRCARTAFAAPARPPSTSPT